MKAFRKISSILKYLFFLFLGLSPVFVLAAPEGGIIVNGSGSISQDTNITNINQTSQNLIVNWNQFNIQPNEIVNFYQPNQSSIALNRVLGLNGTEILGQLNANGHQINLSSRALQVLFLIKEIFSLQTMVTSP